MALTNKQRAFVEHYLQSWNATEAALLAGYSEKSARVIGSQNLTKPDIKAEIDARLEEMTMSSNEVLKRLSEQARAEYAPYIEVRELPADDDGNSDVRAGIDLVRMVEDGKAHLIKGIKYDRDGRPIVEFYDAQAALVQLGRHYKLFSDNVDLTTDGKPLPIGIVKMSVDEL